MEFEPRELLDSEKAADLFSDYEGGYPRKDYNSPQEIWSDVMSPFIDLLSKKARVAGITHGVKGTVVRFLLFPVLLGMIQPRRIDDVWVPKALSYDARLSQLLTRREYYRLNRVLRPDVTLLIERCNEVWGSLWELGAVASLCGNLYRESPTRPESNFTFWLMRLSHTLPMSIYTLVRVVNYGVLPLSKAT